VRVRRLGRSARLLVSAGLLLRARS
jgi:hypothetical protein